MPGFAILNLRVKFGKGTALWFAGKSVSPEGPLKGTGFSPSVKPFNSAGLQPLRGGFLRAQPLAAPFPFSGPWPLVPVPFAKSFVCRIGFAKSFVCRINIFFFLGGVGQARGSFFFDH